MSTICATTRQAQFALVGSLRDYTRDKATSARVLSYILARLLNGSLALGQVISKRTQKKNRSEGSSRETGLVKKGPRPLCNVYQVALEISNYR